MFFTTKLRLTLAAGAISTAAMACGGAPDLAPSPAVKQNGITFSAKASARSQSALQVTRWHSTIESGVHGAVVLDGQDRTGRLKYLQTAFVDAKTHTAHVQVIYPEKGEIVWDIERQVVLSNTLPASVQPYARGIYYDFQMAHPLRGGVTQAYSYLSGAIKIAAGAALVVAGGFVDATILGAPVGAVMNAVGARVVAAGIVDVIYSASEKMGKDDTVAPPADSNAPATGGDKVGDAATAVKATVDDANPGASPPDAPAASTGTDPAAPGSDPAAPGSDPAAPGSDPAAPGNDPAAPGTDPAAPGTQVADNGMPAADNGAAATDASGAATDGAALPSENGGGNLDTVDPGASATNDPGNGGAATDTSNGAAATDTSNGAAATDTSNGGAATDTSNGADNSGGNSGGDTGGDSSGSAEAAHICRKVAVSTTTKIRACIHY